MVFFIDRNLGRRFAEILEAASIDVRRHDDEFPSITPDDEWMAEVGARGWIAVTRDKRIRYKPNERAAVLAHRVRMIVLIGKATYPDLANNFVATREAIEAFAGGTLPPYIAKLYSPTTAELKQRAGAPGRIELWYRG